MVGARLRQLPLSKIVPDDFVEPARDDDRHGKVANRCLEPLGHLSKKLRPEY
jgi:hypothetical protein